MLRPGSQPHLAPWHGWLPLLVLPGAVLLAVPGDWPRWALMWLLALTIYGSCKWLTWRRTPALAAAWWRHPAYLIAWPGMDAAAFLGVKEWQAPRGPAARRPTVLAWAFASGKLILGCAILGAMALWVPREWTLIRGWTGMLGLVLVLHFGGFHLLSCFWRQLGVDARPLMNWPLLATSASDFWGRRWNTAFRDLAHRFLFQPLAARLGPRWGIAAGFAFSGVVHDIVISVPARGGYGLPTLYFVLQGVALLAERSALGRRLGLGRGWRGWAFTMLAVGMPAFGLFHPPFVRQVVVPFLDVFDRYGG